MLRSAAFAAAARSPAAIVPRLVTAGLRRVDCNNLTSARCIHLAASRPMAAVRWNLQQSRFTPNLHRSPSAASSTSGARFVSSSGTPRDLNDLRRMIEESMRGHHRHRDSDAQGHTSRNPHYSAMLATAPHGASQGLPPLLRSMLIAIIAINMAVFGAWTLSKLDNPLPPGVDPRLISSKRRRMYPDLERVMYENFTTSARNLREGRWYTIVTSGFSHEGPLHLAFNMLTLWTLAPPVLLSMMALRPSSAAARFLAMYISSIAVASVAQTGFNMAVRPATGAKPGRAWQPDGSRPQLTYDIPSLGASGGVFGVFGVYALLWPRSKLHVFLIPKAFQVRSLLPVTLIGSAILSVTPFGGGIGHWAHIGGAITGCALYLLGALGPRFAPELLHPLRHPHHLYQHFQAIAAQEAQQAAWLRGEQPMSQPPSPSAPTPNSNLGGQLLKAAFKPTPRAAKPPNAPPPRSYSTMARAEHARARPRPAR